MSDLKLRKSERLSRKKEIADLFDSGQSVKAYPIRIIYRVIDTPGPFPANAAFSVPKRQFRKAHQRNLIKRRLRAAYRIHKQTFYQDISGNRRVNLMLIYTSGDVCTFDTIQRAVSKSLRRLTENLNP